jgi:hypothetical protein
VKLLIVAWWTRFRSRKGPVVHDAIVSLTRNLDDTTFKPSTPTVVTALPLKPDARRRLAELLGNLNVVDICDRALTSDLTTTVDVVIAPVCSPQMIRRLKAMFPTARVIVVELEDWEFGIDASGPVSRLRNAGADAYLAAGSLENLADQLSSRRREDPVAPSLAAQALASEVTHQLNTASVDDLVLERLLRAEAIREEQKAELRRPT